MNLSATKTCCFQTAHQSESTVCHQCESPLLKCTGFEACGGLLNSDQVCTSCFAPELNWVREDEKMAVGQSVQLKLELANRSTAVRSLQVRQVWVRLGSGDWSTVDLPWEQVASGSVKPIWISTGPLQTAGQIGVEVVLILGVAHGFHKDAYAFHSQFSISLEDKQDVVVQQNIHYAADAPQAGATIYAPVRVQSDRSTGRVNQALAAQPLRLSRARRYECQFGIRDANVAEVQPMTRVEYREPGSSDSAVCHLFGQRKSQLWFGRSRSIEEGGPNDIRLVFHHSDGTVDESSSLQISRQHFCLLLEQGQLKARSLSPRGILIDGKLVAGGENTSVGPGSRIELPAGHRKLVLRLGFEQNENRVQRITIQRLA